jgi:Domain of unknown function (DUF4388)
MTTPGRDPEDRALTLRGTIEETSVPELMRSVLGSGETGVLTFHRRGVTKNIYLHMGRIVYARSSDPDERLGEDLLLRGKITVRQYLEASKQIRPGRRLGTILVELSAIESEDLLSSLEHHVKEMLLDVFTWTTGEYELAMSEPGKEDVITLNFSMENLILEGVRRIRSWSRIYRGIGGDFTAVPVPTGNTETLLKLELSDEEQEVLSHATGRATLEQICQVSYLTNIETCRILWALQVLGVLRREQPGEAASSSGRWTSSTWSRSSTRCSAGSTRSSGGAAATTWTASWRTPWPGWPRATRRSSTGSTSSSTGAPTTSRCWPTWPTCPPSSARPS